MGREKGEERGRGKEEGGRGSKRFFGTEIVFGNEGVGTGGGQESGDEGGRGGGSGDRVEKKWRWSVDGLANEWRGERRKGGKEMNGMVAGGGS